MKLKANICLDKLSRVGVGGWLEKLGIRLSQLPTKLKLKLKLKLSLAILLCFSGSTMMRRCTGLFLEQEENYRDLFLTRRV